MKLVFVYWAFEDMGSGLVINGYTEAAKELGHEVAVYGRWRFGRDNPKIPLNYSLDVESADGVVFLFEWTTEIKPGDQLDLARLVATVPRERRVVLDADGNYNDVIAIDGDFNHREAEQGRRWTEVCDSLSDKICQPTLHPVRSNVRPFLFYAYEPSWAVPLDPGSKEFGMIYVGHSKFRWRPMERVLRALEPIRHQLGRIGLVGYGWESAPWWAQMLQVEDAYCPDTAYLRHLGVEVLPPVPFGQVIKWMSRGLLNPVLLRPTFSHLRFVTPRVFETLAASTFPLYALDEEHVREICSDRALELVLPEDHPGDKLVDMLDRPEHYAETVRAVREHLEEKHSLAARLRELIEIVEA
jgi:hypothetical protein